MWRITQHTWLLSIHRCYCVCVLACCRTWDAGLIDALMPQLMPQLHSKVTRSCDVSWNVAAVRGFLTRFHLQVYHQLSCTLVILRQLLFTRCLSVVMLHARVTCTGIFTLCMIDWFVYVEIPCVKKSFCPFIFSKNTYFYVLCLCCVIGCKDVHFSDWTMHG